MGALEASRDTETGQEASRAAPVPGPMVERGARAAKADPGTRVAMAEQGVWAAMVDPGTREAMADQGTLEAMAGLPKRLRPQPQRLEPYYPPKKIPWGK